MRATLLYQAGDVVTQFVTHRAGLAWRAAYGVVHPPANRR